MKGLGGRNRDEPRQTLHGIGGNDDERREGSVRILGREGRNRTEVDSENDNDGKEEGTNDEEMQEV